MSVLGSYKNGNYNVVILYDGTKIRFNKADSLVPDYPESMDLKITDFCDMGCPMCHENSTCYGKHGEIMKLKFIDTLPPFTELAIGGGNPLSHPSLVPFLEKCQEKKLIPSMTVNQKHFLEYQSYIKSLVDHKLIYGLGVSLTNPTDEFIDKIKQFPNAVVHVINGIVTLPELKALKDNGLKVLVLGYKEFRRGKKLYADELSKISIDSLKTDLYNALPEIINNNWFKVVSFDNLAIRQLDPKRIMTDTEWEEFYMGDDGMFTMYVDAVNGEYAVSSTSVERHPLTNDIKEMFDVIRRNPQ